MCILYMCESIIYECIIIYLCASVSQSVSSIFQSCMSLCSHMDCSTQGLPVHHQLLGFIQIHVH